MTKLKYFGTTLTNKIALRKTLSGYKNWGVFATSQFGKLFHV
jgi:hypothetical protein